MAVSISGTSGTWSHGSTVTINGSGFGTKVTAAPLVWDDCSTGTIPTDNGKWSGFWPYTGDTAYWMDYTTPIRSIALPHSNITRYCAGCHATSGDAHYNVMLWKTFNVTSYPQTYYVSWYARSDPAALPSRADWNIKYFDWSYGASPYTMSDCLRNNWYSNYAPTGVPITAATSGLQHQLNDDTWAWCAGSLQSPTDNNGHNTSYWGSGRNVYTRWIKYEMLIVVTNTSAGRCYLWEDGVLKMNYEGRTDAWTLGSRALAIGGYSRDTGLNCWRFIADAYLDTTAQRVVISESETWQGASYNVGAYQVTENQIPTAWTDTSITVTVNLGAHPGSVQRYLYVFDATGTPNPNGYPITTNAGSSVVAPVASFSASVVTGQAPLSVSFTDTSSNTPTAWAWDFDTSANNYTTPDTAATVGPHAVTYDYGGAFNARLTVTNSAGSDAEDKALSVRYLKPSNFGAN